ncbi:MAG: HlyD family efflux transporter periplasmic adaptor subunit, partial [Calditrichaeota bacterium]|nr:HlyD family efflux transporter periplasmic adaptor subunit [Calditrichota bacterium]
MVDTVRIYGRVKLRHEVWLASQFDGRLSDFTLLMGDRVRKGQKIGEIVPPAREALLQAMPQVDPKLRPILERHVKTIPLLSPIDGVVLEVLHKQGDVVQKGEAIVHIGDLRVLDVRGDLPVEYLPVARKLRQMSVRFLDFSHPSVLLPVKAISGQADATKQTVPIRLELRNPRGEFKAGVLVQIVFPGAEHRNTLAIPRAALL